MDPASLEQLLKEVQSGHLSIEAAQQTCNSPSHHSFGSIAALLGILNSCASGVSVVNIDNGLEQGMSRP